MTEFPTFQPWPTMELKSPGGGSIKARLTLDDCPICGFRLRFGWKWSMGAWRIAAGPCEFCFSQLCPQCKTGPMGRRQDGRGMIVLTCSRCQIEILKPPAFKLAGAKSQTF